VLNCFQGGKKERKPKSEPYFLACGKKKGRTKKRDRCRPLVEIGKKGGKKRKKKEKSTNRPIISRRRELLGEKGKREKKEARNSQYATPPQGKEKKEKGSPFPANLTGKKRGERRRGKST